MPKEIRPAMAHHSSTASAPYPIASSSGARNVAIWSAGDDEILLQARASGLNWQPIANSHFPVKTANACRKRHERLIERRHVEDWDAQKLELLAQEYMACRKEMWEALALRVGERWGVVEAKCMGNSLKTLQATARSAQRRVSASQNQLSFEERGISDHNSDSGIGLGSDTEMEAGDAPGHAKSASWHVHPGAAQQQDHTRSRSLPQLLPLYRPPPPITQARRILVGTEVLASPQAMIFQQPLPSFSRHSPDSNGRGGISIQSVLS
ncbi:hypothetical protein LTR08_008286 [Meristemomyces frigidus]|nr:hypothetical protein LTR08_008286 [Meristemomyces frigidus]